MSLACVRPFQLPVPEYLTVPRFHLPLIKPDVRVSRIRLSDKVSRVRAREVTLDPTKSDQTELQIQVFR